MFKNTCIAMAACLAAGTAIAGEGAPPSPPHPLVQTVSNLFSKMQALPLQLLPARQSASAPTKPAAKTLPTEIGCCIDEEPAPQQLAKLEVSAPAPQPAPSPVLQSTGPAQHWQLDVSDGSVKRALQRWSSASGWQLVWELPVDFPVGAQAAFNGGFEEAVAAVAVSLQNSEMPLKAIFYRGNKVLRIVAKGVQ